VAGQAFTSDEDNLHYGVGASLTGDKEKVLSVAAESVGPIR